MLVGPNGRPCERRERKVDAIFGARALRAAAREASRAGFTVLVADELLGLRRRGIVADAPRLRVPRC